VADFIGTTNLLTGDVESADDGTAVVRLGSGERCVVSRGTLATGDDVELSIRPESVELTASGGSGTASPALTAIVEQVAYLGGTVQYIVRTRGGLSLTAVASKTGERIPVGGEVDVSWRPAEALVLAAAGSQERMEAHA
jgi:spermidine/putrescine transport system ATP-binding protein